MNLADRASMLALEECYTHGIAFVPFFPLGSAFTGGNFVLGSPRVIATAARLGHTSPDSPAVAAQPTAERAADPRHVLDTPPPGEHGRREHRTRRRSTRATRPDGIATQDAAALGPLRPWLDEIAAADALL